MNFFKRLLLCIIVCLFALLSQRASAQNGQYDVRVTVKDYNCSVHEVTLQVWVKAHTAAQSFLMGDANYRFEYDPRIIKTPRIFSQDNFSNVAPARDFNYGSQNINGSTEGSSKAVLSLNTFYTGSAESAKQVTDVWTSVSCLKFDVVDTTQCFDIIWHDDQTFPVTGMNEVIVNTASPYDYSLYVVPSSGTFLNLNSCYLTECSNKPPLAVSDTTTTNEDRALSSTVASNDSDPDNLASELTYTTLTSVAANQGVLTMNANGSYTFTPAANYNGIVTIDYRVCDLLGLCDTATLSITVTAVNDAPMAVNDPITIDEDNVATGSVAPNDTDTEGDAMTYTAITTVPSNQGVLTMNANGGYTFTPAANFNGTVVIEYRVCDATLCDTATLTITVSPVNDAPVASSSTVPTNEDAPLTGTVITSITDVDDASNTLTVTPITSIPSGQGVLTLNPDGTYTFTPTPNFTGTVTVDYKVCDPSGACDTATLTITVTAVNDAPLAVNDTLITPEDTAATGSLATNDSDADNTSAELTYTSLSNIPGSQGLLVLNADGTYTFTPALNFNGTIHVNYKVCDLGGACDTATLTITLTAVNDAPVASNSNVPTGEDTPTSGTVLPNIIDVDNPSNTLTVTPITNVPSGQGVLTMNPDGTYTFTPTPNFNGTVSVDYKVCDPSGACDTATLIITVNAVNDAPIAVNDTVTTDEDRTTTGTVATNDSDAEGDALSFTVLTSVHASQGVLTFNSDGTYTFIPAANYNGIVTVDYKVCDMSKCDTATLTITVSPVNDKPVVADATVPTANNQRPITCLNILDADTADTHTVTVCGNPAQGTVTTSVNNATNQLCVTYTPNASFVGQDSVCLLICDSGSPQTCDTVKLYYNVSSSNLAPVAVNDVNITLNSASTSGNVLSNDSDPNNNTLVVSTTPVVAPAHGTLVLNANGTYTYTPNSSFVGTETILYQVCDNGAPSLCDTGALVIEVRSSTNNVTNNPVAINDNVSGPSGTAIIVAVKANDYDPTGSSLGNPSIVGVTVGGTATVNPDGTVTFVPSSGFVGTANFNYEICNTGTPVLCDTATVTVDVYANPLLPNLPPVAVKDVVATTKNMSVAGDVSLNDSDPNAGQALIFSAVSSPAHGTVSMNSDGQFSYTPNTNYVGVDTFSYTVCDNASPSLCSTARVDIIVTQGVVAPTNSAPIATADNPVIQQGTPTIIDVASNDYDPNGGPLSNPMITTAPTSGTAVVNPDGTITFTPNPLFTGTTAFTYTICDFGTPALCDSATVTVTVVPTVGVTNVAPTAQNDATTTPENTAVIGDVSSNDTDLNAGQTLTYAMSTQPTNGTVALQPNGIFTYIPTNGFVGIDSFSYAVCDNGLPALCDTAWVLIEVTTTNVNTNTSPMAADDNVTTYAGDIIIVNVLANDVDLNGNQTLSSPTIIGTPVGGTAVVNPNGTVTFTPQSGFTGIASFSYAVCDNGSPSLCDTAQVQVTVKPAVVLNNINIAPLAVDDAARTYKNTSLTSSVATNDSDVNTGQTLTFSLLSSATHGSVSLNANGTYTYVPVANYIGPDQFVYKVCDNGVPSKCDTAMVYLTVFDFPCAALDLKVILEGAYNASTGKMRTTLNQRGLLPGQTPMGQFAVATPAGQPFNTAPWNYNGVEAVTNYAPTVVDWVLVSIRTDNVNASSNVFKTAALLHDDGHIQFIDTCFKLPVTGTYYALVEHRNHIGVMSPSALSIVNGKIAFDFTAANSYVLMNPPSFGQKLVNGKWMMYAGDGKKNTQTSNYDINFNDSQLWKIESGLFDQYRLGDFNLDADVNFQDQTLWKANNGKYSGVPH